MKEYKKIEKFIKEELSKTQKELDYYNKLSSELQFKIEHEKRFIKAIMGDNKNDKKAFSSSKLKNKIASDLSEDHENLESLTAQLKVVEDNRKNYEEQTKKLIGYLDDIKDIGSEKIIMVEEKIYNNVKKVERNYLPIHHFVIH